MSNKTNYSFAIVASSEEVARRHFVLEEGAFVYENGPQKFCIVKIPELQTDYDFDTDYIFYDENVQDFPTRAVGLLTVSEIEELAEKTKRIEGLSVEVVVLDYDENTDRLNVLNG